MIEKLVIIILRSFKYGSPLAMRLTKLTGKSPYNTHPKHLIGQQTSNDWILKEINKSDIVLDLGSNDGSITKLVAKRCKKIVGVEIDDEIIGIATTRLKKMRIKNFKFIKANAEERLPFDDNSFDNVVAIDVIEHLNNYKKTLRDIYRILKPSGKLIMSVPNINTRWKQKQKEAGLFYYSDPDHKIEFGERELKTLIKKSGFDVVKFDTMVYDTPLAGLIDIVGGFSLTIYRMLSVWKERYAQKHPSESNGWKLVCIKLNKSTQED